MSKLAELVKIIKSMKQFMPESSRTMLATKLLGWFVSGMDQASLKAIKDQKLPEIFYRDCGIIADYPHVFPRLVITETKLSEFMEKWYRVGHYRLDGEEVPLSEEAMGIKMTMLQELRQLCENGGYDGSVQRPTDVSKND